MSEWININDQLPEIGQKVIINTSWVNLNYPESCSARAAIYTNAISGEGRFSSENLDVTFPDVEFWYPMPEVPKKKHFCDLGDILCFTTTKEKLLLKFYSSKGSLKYLFVQVCPFCGTKAELKGDSE